MPNAKFLDMSNMFIKGLVKGNPKTGKTTFVGTWPHPFFFVFDSGIKALVGQDVNYKEYFDNDPQRPVAFVNADADLDAAVASAKINGRVIYDEKNDRFYTQKAPKELKAPLKHIETMAVDCAGPLLDAAMNYAQFSRQSAGSVPSEHDWFPQMHNFSQFINKALGLPCHVWLITYEQIKEIKSRKGDVSIGTRILPDVTGKLATKIEGKFDICVRTVVEHMSGKTHYKLQATYRGIYEAGHRFQDAFGLWIDPPTYEEVKKNLDQYIKNKNEIQKRLLDNRESLQS